MSAGSPSLVVWAKHPGRAAVYWPAVCSQALGDRVSVRFLGPPCSVSMYRTRLSRAKTARRQPSPHARGVALVLHGCMCAQANSTQPDQVVLRVADVLPWERHKPTLEVCVLRLPALFKTFHFCRSSAAQRQVMPSAAAAHQRILQLNCRLIIFAVMNVLPADPAPARALGRCAGYRAATRGCIRGCGPGGAQLCVLEAAVFNLRAASQSSMCACCMPIRAICTWHFLHCALLIALQVARILPRSPQQPQVSPAQAVSPVPFAAAAAALMQVAAVRAAAGNSGSGAGPSANPALTRLLQLASTPSARGACCTGCSRLLSQHEDLAACPAALLEQKQAGRRLGRATPLL